MNQIFAVLSVLLVSASLWRGNAEYKLTGIWEVSKVEFDKQSVPAADLAGWKVIISKDNFALEEKGELLHAKIVFVHTKVPNGIDLHILDGINAGKVSKGIFQIRDKELFLCLARPMTNRPDAFVSSDSSTLMVLKKSKP